MRILIKGAGDLATGVAWELHKSGHDILMTEIAQPMTVRRFVAFSRAVYDGSAEVDDVKSVLVSNLEEALQAQVRHEIPVMVDEHATIREFYRPDVLIDGIMAKRNTGTTKEEAPLVIALGPGFTAGQDCDAVIETQRGGSLGNVIWNGSAIPNTGIPGNLGGCTTERLLRASADGVMEPRAAIGDIVKAGQVVARIGGKDVKAQISGVIRGLLQEGAPVSEGLKIGDVDPRGIRELCWHISDKAHRIGQGALDAVEAAGSRVSHPRGGLRTCG